MILNYIKIALRNLSRHKGYTSINILGLAVGMALFILALLYSNFHLGFDKFHDDAERIHWLTRTIKGKNSEELHSYFSSTTIKPLLDNKIPGIEDIVRFTEGETQIIKFENKKFLEKKIFFVDERFLSFFSFDLLSGDKGSALKEPNSVVITETIKKKFFGEENPVGKSLYFSRYKTDLKITGILKDLPPNSSLKFNYLISSRSSTLKQWWSDSSTLVKLKSGVDLDKVNKKLAHFVKKNLPIMFQKREKLYLSSYLDTHLNSIGMMGPITGTSPIQFYLILIVAVALLIIVSINFANLATAKYFNRAKEVGIRKVVGAQRGQLMRQFLSESILLSFLGLPLALALYEIIRPAFISFVGVEIKLSLLNNPGLILILILVSVLLGILSGIYPAFFLSSFKPAAILKGNLKTGNKGSGARKFLVIFQLFISIVLMIITFIVIKQYHYLMKVDLGVNRENVISIPISNEIEDRILVLKDELLKNPKIENVSYSCWYPFNWNDRFNVIPDGYSKDEKILMQTYLVNYDYLELFKVKIIEGRSFSPDFKDENSIVISELTKKTLGWKNPIGKTITVHGKKRVIIGVAADFHFLHVFEEATPALFFLNKKNISNYLFIRVKEIDEYLISFIKKKWQEFLPNYPFSSINVNHFFEDSLRESLKIIQVFKLISFTSIFIAGLGIFGLASYSSEQKTKEIGVRKILGATVGDILKMILKEFSSFVLIANMAAIPIAYLLSKWFLEWAWVKKTDIGFLYFVLGILISFGITFISVGYQAVKAAIGNPVDALRND